MSWERSKHSRHVVGAVLFALSSMGWVSETRAQGHTPDPYRPYNQQYDQFVYPSYPTGYGLTPNQDVLEGRSGYGGANQFQRFLESDGDMADEFGQGRRRSGPGVPYYSAYRQFDRDYNRVYQPNQESDQHYYEDKNARHEKYVAYLKERDPRKRAELYREYLNDSRKVSRDLSGTRSTTSRRTAADRPSTTKPEDRGSATGARRGRPSAPSTESSSRSTLFGRSRSGSFSTPSTTRTPSEILKDNEELESPGRPRNLTAPGLAPRSGSSRPR